MESRSSEVAVRSQLLEYIKKRETTKLIDCLENIKKNNQSEILLKTEDLEGKKTGYTILSYAIKHRMHDSVIEKILEITEKENILKKLLKTVDYYMGTALSLAIRKNNNPKIIKLLLKKEQETGLTTQIFYKRSSFVNIFYNYPILDSTMGEVDNRHLNESKQCGGYDNAESPSIIVYLTNSSKIIEELNNEQLIHALNASNTEIFNPGIPSSSSNLLSDIYIVDNKIVTVCGKPTV